MGSGLRAPTRIFFNCHPPPPSSPQRSLAAVVTMQPDRLHSASTVTTGTKAHNGDLQHVTHSTLLLLIRPRLVQAAARIPGAKQKSIAELSIGMRTSIRRPGVEIDPPDVAAVPGFPRNIEATVALLLQCPPARPSAASLINIFGEAAGADESLPGDERGCFMHAGLIGSQRLCSCRSCAQAPLGWTTRRPDLSL